MRASLRAAPPEVECRRAARGRAPVGYPRAHPSGRAGRRTGAAVAPEVRVVDYDPFSDEVRDDPLPLYARLRRESPVHYVERFDCFALSRFEDVWNVGQDPATFPSPGPVPELMVLEEQGLMPTGVGGFFEERDASIFNMNPPDHTQVRRRLAPLFSPQRLARIEPRLREIVRALLAQALPKGRLDAIGDLAGRVSVRAACLLIGLPESDADELGRLVARFFAREPGVQGMAPDAVAAAIEINEYLLRAVEARRRRGVGDADATDVFLGLELGGRALTDRQAAMHLTTLLNGGTETLPKVFAGGVLQLHRHPEQRALLAADPRGIPDAFTEIARYEMPTNYLTRSVAREVELHGTKLSPGQGVMLLYRSANRDEREFEYPDRFDVRRRPPRTLAFGHGTHVCLGQHVARLEARIMYEELLAAVPDYAIDERQVVPARSEFVAGYLAVPIEFAPRAAPPGWEAAR
jgi:cytochrome P450